MQGISSIRADAVRLLAAAVLVAGIGAAASPCALDNAFADELAVGEPAATVSEAAAPVKDVSESYIPAIGDRYTTSLKKVKPKVKVVLDGKVLKAGRDYTVSYKNNKNPGTARAVVTGKGDYTGRKTVKFKLVNLGDDMARQACKLSYSRPRSYGQGYAGTKRYLATSAKYNYNYARACDGVVGTIVRSSRYDSKFTCGLASQQPYLGYTGKKKTRKWVCIGTYKDGEENRKGGRMRPGDVVMRHGHVCMYVGNKLAVETYDSFISGTDGDLGRPNGNWVSGRFGWQSGYPSGKTPGGYAACIGKRSFAAPKYGDVAKIYRCVTPDCKRSASSGKDFILRDSDKKLYSKKQLGKLTLHELFLARNEIFARHGISFANQSLKSWFASKAWYKPTRKPGSLKLKNLNRYERSNARAILALEQEKNSPYV